MKFGLNWPSATENKILAEFGFHFLSVARRGLIVACLDLPIACLLSNFGV